MILFRAEYYPEHRFHIATVILFLADHYPAHRYTQLTHCFLDLFYCRSLSSSSLYIAYTLIPLLFLVDHYPLHSFTKLTQSVGDFYLADHYP